MLMSIVGKIATKHSPDRKLNNADMPPPRIGLARHRALMHQPAEAQHDDDEREQSDKLDL